ncbi:hypothetical protein ACFE04_004669 [Oxalis oulophora]
MALSSSSSMGVRKTCGHASPDGNERIVAPMKCGCGSKSVGGCRLFMWYEPEVSPYDRIWKESQIWQQIALTCNRHAGDHLFNENFHVNLFLHEDLEYCLLVIIM